MSVVPFDLILSVAAGVTSLLAAVLTQLLSAKRRKDRQNETEQIEQIAKAFQAEQEARRALAIEKTAERIPAGLSPDQFNMLLSELTKRPSAGTTQVTDRAPIESLISGYHEQALSQARAQFWFSVVAATVGFAWILYAGSDIQAEKFVTVSKMLPGVVMDAVAFLFFRQASETRQRATELYDRLRRDKQLSESVALVSSIEDVRVRSAVKAQIALHMSGLEPTPIDLSNFLSRHDSEPPRVET